MDMEFISETGVRGWGHCNITERKNGPTWALKLGLEFPPLERWVGRKDDLSFPTGISWVGGVSFNLHVVLAKNSIRKKIYSYSESS
jgi:hypothetical protein